MYLNDVKLSSHVPHYVSEQLPLQPIVKQLFQVIIFLWNYFMTIMSSSRITKVVVNVLLTFLKDSREIYNTYTNSEIPLSFLIALTFQWLLTFFSFLEITIEEEKTPCLIFQFCYLFKPIEFQFTLGLILVLHFVDAFLSHSFLKLHVDFRFVYLLSVLKILSFSMICMRVCEVFFFFFQDQQGFS